MATLSKVIPSTRAANCLRPYDVWRDLSAVADLIELCFADTLDGDGQRYLEQMRSASRSPSLLRWLNLARERTNLPLAGFVWEEDGRVVGNLTLIPHYHPRQRYYLIANVAVHPDYRRTGIASSLTQQAIDVARQRGARAAWLQVRDDNPGAIRLYHSLGFIERARRTTWGCSAPAGLDPALSPLISIRSATPLGLVVAQRMDQDWSQQQAWLRASYPPDLLWHLNLKINALRPGFLGLLYRMWNDVYVQQWSARREGRLLAVLAWQSLAAFSDHLWLAAQAEPDEEAVTALLVHARRRLSSRRMITLDYPAGKGVEAIRAAGFQPLHTLIWMSLDTR